MRESARETQSVGGKTLKTIARVVKLLLMVKLCGRNGQNISKIPIKSKKEERICVFSFDH
jgi:hypothetical protein